MSKVGGKSSSDDGSCVKFERKIFTQMENAYFRKSEQTEEPVYVINLGGEEVTLPFKGICREFDIEVDSQDGEMLNLVAEALDFVKVLRIGDAIPREVLTGEASWEVTDKHREIAYQRLSMQLVTWLTGADEWAITDPDELLQVAEDPNTKKKVTDAFDAAGEELGFGKKNGEKVVQVTQELAEAVAYIETLRSKFRLMQDMLEKIEKFQELYSRERSVMEIIRPLRRLAITAVENFEGIFMQVDGQTGEIIGVLKNVDSQKKYIGEIRDDLYKRLMAWDETLTAWEKEPLIRSGTAVELMRETYRFLAPRFMKVDDWLLVSKLQENEEESKTAVVW